MYILPHCSFNTGKIDACEEIIVLLRIVFHCPVDYVAIVSEFLKAFITETRWQIAYGNLDRGRTFRLIGQISHATHIHD
jgi:hypothetical protein